MIGKSSVPKNVIINYLEHNFKEENIRTELYLPQDGVLSRQLDNQNKSTLVNFLSSSNKGKQLLTYLEGKYPISGAPTYYLVISRNLPSTEKIIEKSFELVGKNITVPNFKHGKIIKCVYNTEEARVLDFGFEIIEIPIYYERLIEYTSTELETWGEVKALYDLRRGFIWISHTYDHGLVACSDFSAINPIQNWANDNLSLRLDLPNIPIDMFHKLAAGGTPRTATFAAKEFSLQPSLDVQSLSVYDQELEVKDTFQKLKSDQDNWEQTAGYFSRHPSIPVGGLGIARRYGRIWTPNHLPKDQLLASAMDLISRTDTALSEKLKSDDKSYMDHFRSIKVQINGKVITKGARNIFDDIAWSIVRGIKNRNNQEQISNDLVTKIIENKDILGFVTTIEADCGQCGFVLVKCPICSSPYEAVVINGQIRITCPRHPDRVDNLNEVFKCECGEEINIIIPNNIKIYPLSSTISAFRDFLSQKDSKFDGWFVIDGNLLCTYRKSTNLSKQYHLFDFQKWQVRAHIHSLGSISENREKKIKKILQNLKEKCSIGNYHPYRQDCDDCFNKSFSTNNINSENMCLPRLLGFAIDEKFDGIHTGNEKADVKYQDMLAENNQSVQIGIHLKSKEKNTPNRGVGQNSPGIKGLYAQFFFTLHKGLTGNKLFDIIGISIPSKIFDETRVTFINISKELNMPILVLDEEAWVSITAAALDNIEAQNKMC